MADDGVTERDEWVVTWFPSDKPDRSKAFTTEGKARAHAATEGVVEWHPLLERRITTTVVVSELVPLETASPCRMVPTDG